jgi:hypothetical protein
LNFCLLIKRMAEGKYSGGIPHPDLHVQLPLLHRSRQLPHLLFAHIPIRDIYLLVLGYEDIQSLVPREIYYLSVLMDSVINTCNRQTGYTLSYSCANWPPLYESRDMGITLTFPDWWYENGGRFMQCFECNVHVPKPNTFRRQWGWKFYCRACLEWFACKDKPATPLE